MENRMHSLSPNLMVKNVNETLDFYTQVLGFKKIDSVPETGTLNWAMIKLDAITFMFQERKNIVEEYPALNSFENGGGLTFYIKVSNVEELYKVLKGKVKMVKDLHKMFYGAEEFAIEDNNGYILTFAQNEH
jgi:lactoylglutathione lyase